jgi:hypothetical protein
MRDFLGAHIPPMLSERSTAMSTTTEVARPNPFGIISLAIKDTKVREASDAAEALQRDRAIKIAREARAAEEAAARQAEELAENVFKFQEAFAFSVVKSDRFKNLKSVAQEAILNYCMALASPDQVLPGIDPSMAYFVNDKFTYGIVLAGLKIPEDYFVGQRQDWFPELHSKKLGLGRPAPISYEVAVAPPKIMPTAVPVATSVSELPPAITPKTSRIKGAQRKQK